MPRPGIPAQSFPVIPHHLLDLDRPPLVRPGCQGWTTQGPVRHFDGSRFNAVFYIERLSKGLNTGADLHIVGRFLIPPGGRIQPREQRKTFRTQQRGVQATARAVHDIDELTAGRSRNRLFLVRLKLAAFQVDDVRLGQVVDLFPESEQFVIKLGADRMPAGSGFDAIVQRKAGIKSWFAA